MSQDIKPCPFCGHIGLDFCDGSTYRWGIAYCVACQATCGEVRREYPDTGKWHAEAIKEWNTRAQAPAAEPLSEGQCRELQHRLFEQERLNFSNHSFDLIVRATERAHGIGAESNPQPAMAAAKP